MACRAAVVLKNREDKVPKKILWLTTLLAICALVPALAACANNANVGSEVSLTEAEAAEPGPGADAAEHGLGDGPVAAILQPVVEEPTFDVDEFNAQWLDTIPLAEGTFGLTQEESEFYEEYIRTGDIAVLYGAGAFQVIKMSIQAAIDGNFEHEFNLFHPDTHAGMTIEVFAPPPDAPLEHTGSLETRQRWADFFYGNIDDGVFTDEGNRASISFYSDIGEPVTIWARLHENGIWMVELD